MSGSILVVKSKDKVAVGSLVKREIAEYKDDHRVLYNHCPLKFNERIILVIWEPFFLALPVLNIIPKLFVYTALMIVYKTRHKGRGWLWPASANKTFVKYVEAYT